MARGLNEQEKTSFLALYERHVDTVFRVCRTYLKNTSDTEDATQNVFLKLLSKPRAFESVEHEKAWLIRVASNHCKDVLKSSWNKRASFDEIKEPTAMDSYADEVDEDIKRHVMELPENQRVCILLFYYEGYNAAEIASLLDKPHSTIRNYLSDARKHLKMRLESSRDG